MIRQMIRKSALTAAVAFALAMTALPAAGGTVMGNGGATEITQLLNHAQLLMQYEKQITQAETELNSFVALQKQLTSLPDQAMGAINSAKSVAGNGNMSNVSAAESMLNSLNSLGQNVLVMNNETNNAVNAITYMQARGQNMTTSQYMVGMAALAQQQNGVYQQRLTAYNTALTQSQTDIAQVNNIAAQAPQISSEVGGLQALLASNAVIAQQLVGIKQALLESGAMHAQDEMQGSSTGPGSSADQSIRTASDMNQYQSWLQSFYGSN